jgi:cytochrome c oxidase subunit 4
MNTDVSHIHVSRKEYWFIFSALAALTALEVGVVYMPGVGKGLVVSALVLMALAKAALVGLFFMHLKHETPVLRSTVIVPLAMPFLYALVLILEAAWRLVW